MKRLLGIMLVNAWGGLRQKTSLPTMSLVAIGVISLVLASTVTAGASPNSSLPGVNRVASFVRTAITDTEHVASIGSEPTEKPNAAPLKPKSPSANSNTQSANGGNSAGTGNTSQSSSSGTTGTTTASSQATTPAANSLTLSPLQCIAGTSGQTIYTINISSALLNLQTATTASSTLTYQW